MDASGYPADAESPVMKAQRLANPDYQRAFLQYDTDKSGTIDFFELRNCLQMVQDQVEASTTAAFVRHAFSDATELALFGRFGAGQACLNFDQFSALCQYVESVKNVFKGVDLDNSGTLNSVVELGRALTASSFAWTDPSGQDPLIGQVAEEIGKTYDGDGNGVLSFDEFLRLRLEWDPCVAAWNRGVGLFGGKQITPQQTLQVLDDAKRQLEPFSQLASLPFLSQLSNGFNSTSFFSSILFPKKFSERTCESLIIRFGNGSPFLLFEHFCMMLNFVKAEQNIFGDIDNNKNGSLDYAELAAAFAKVGLPLHQDQFNWYDQDNSGSIGFDEFLQIKIEMAPMLGVQNQFTAQGLTARELQELLTRNNIRFIWTFSNGVIPVIKPFSLRTCRLLVATYGTARPGERFPTVVNFSQCILMLHDVKLAKMNFQQYDTGNDGALSMAEFQNAMMLAAGSLPPGAIDLMLFSYDADGTGELEFDAFLAMLLECKMFQQRFSQLGATLPGLDASALFQMVYSMPRWL
mmetsp:Transcript_99379/g.155392  ORF Transcript_99379/g.155392 Transcript_99379/m.155392 type:complete len:521 (-) Transcript_99379:36-1598(-)